MNFVMTQKTLIAVFLLMPPLVSCTPNGAPLWEKTETPEERRARETKVLQEELQNWGNSGGQQSFTPAKKGIN
jgi:hypothetical protein